MSRPTEKEENLFTSGIANKSLHANVNVDLLVMIEGHSVDGHERQHDISTNAKKRE